MCPNEILPLTYGEEKKVICVSKFVYVEKKTTDNDAGKHLFFMHSTLNRTHFGRCQEIESAKIKVLDFSIWKIGTILFVRSCNPKSIKIFTLIQFSMREAEREMKRGEKKTALS